MNNLTVIKIGGSTIEEWDNSLSQIKTIIDKGNNILLVHGGGKTVSEWSAKLGIRAEFVKGLRKTDSETLEVACAVLSGLVNNRLVSNLENIGVNAIGLSGISSKLILAKPVSDELGLVGEIKGINNSILIKLIELGYVPVVSPLGFNIESNQMTHDGILNINADFVAGKIASSLKASKIIYQTDVDGILDQMGRVIPRMTLKQAKELLESGIIGGGMIPKLESCIKALENVEYGYIINAYSDSLMRIFEGIEIGTQIHSLRK